MQRYHDTLTSALDAIQGVPGAIVYRRGKVSSQRTDEIAVQYHDVRGLVCGEGATAEEWAVIRERDK